MKNKITYLLLFTQFAIFSQMQLNAPWNNSNKERKQNLTLNEISKSAEEYFNTIDRNKKGSGLKPFKRWEYHWSHYLNNDGSIAPASKLWEAWKQKKELDNNSRTNRTDLSNWTPMGPFENSNTYNASNFKQTGQGRVNAIAVDPNDSNTYYVGAPAGGIWKSTDAGLNWQPLTDYLPQIGVSGIAINPDNSNEIYIATGDDDAGDSYSVGVWKSVDGGNTWSNTGNIPGEPESMNEIYIDPNNTQTILVATSTGVQKSINGGQTWQTKLSGNILDIKMKPGDSNIWYAVSSNTFYKSTNGGEAFNAIDITSLTGSTRLTMDVTVADPNYIYIVSAGSGSAFNGVYKSVNSGSSFTKTNQTSDIFGSSQAWFDLAITASSTNPEIVYVGVLDIWKSINGGNNFSKINDWANPNTTTYTHADIHFLRFIDGKFFVGSDGGIFVSTNEGFNFTDLTKNIAISQFYRISVSPQTLDIIAGGLQDNGGFGFNGEEWKNYHGGDGMEGLVNPLNPNIFYGFTQYGGSLNISNDRGNSRVNIIRAPGEETGTNDSGGEWITPLNINKEGELFAGFKSLYTLNNNNWVKLTNTPFGDDIDKIEIDPLNSDIIYVAQGSNLYKSIDKGQTFDLIYFSTSNINSIEVSNNNSDIAWIVTAQDVFKSENMSSTNPTFINLSGNLPTENKLVIKHHERSGNNTVYLGTNLGVYYINDDLSQWQSFNNNLPNVQIRDIEINEEDARIYVATYGRGVFTSDIPRILPSNDIRLLEIKNIDNNVYCSENFSPIITVKNQGQDVINNINVKIKIDNQYLDDFNWTGIINSEETLDIFLPEITNSLGFHNIQVETTIANDTYNINNFGSSFFLTNNKNITPTEVNDFEDINNDNLITQTINNEIELWEIGSTFGRNLSVPEGSLAYNTKTTGTYPTNTTGYLYTKCYDLTEINEPSLNFKMGFDIEQDWDYLNLEYSTDQGMTWNILGNASDPNWYNSSSDINGLPGNQWTGEGEKINPSDNLSNSTNKDYSLNLGFLANETNVVFRFKFFSDQSQTEEGVVIDNLVVNGVLSTNDEVLLKGIAIYPNPSQSIFNINRNVNDNLNIKVFDITGKLIYSKKNITSLQQEIDLSEYSKGIYVLNMTSNGRSATKKLILK